MTEPSPTAAPAACSPRPRRRRWLRIATIPLILGFVVFLDGYARWPTGSASGLGQQGVLPALAAGKTVFRVATFNIHSGVGGDDNIYNLSRPIEAVRDTDLCGLNEVRGYIFGAIANQAQAMGEATEHAWLYLPTERRYWHDEFGNALLTRLAVQDWLRMPLPIEPVHSGRRNVTLARVLFGAHPVNVLIAHIDREQDQANQVRFVARLFDSLAAPSLIMADLNAEGRNPQIKELLALPDVHDCIAESNADNNAAGRIDWILSRGMKVHGGGHLQNGASDHPIYWVDLEVSPQ